MNIYTKKGGSSCHNQCLKANGNNSENFGHFDTKSGLTTPKSSIRRNLIKQHNIYPEAYNLFEENEMDFNEFYENNFECDPLTKVEPESYNFLNYNENQSILEDNSGFIIDKIEEYSMDFIDDIENIKVENWNVVQNQDMLGNSGGFYNTHSVSSTRKRNRKQGIVGRPTLSSPNELMEPDNVYSHGYHDSEKFLSENNHKTKIYQTKKPVLQNNLEFLSQRGVIRNRPRILLKPRMPIKRINESQCSYLPVEQDPKVIAERQMANQDFVRNLVARAERQGTIIDKKKFPINMFERGPVYRLKCNQLDEEMVQMNDADTNIPLCNTDIPHLVNPAVVVVNYQNSIPLQAPKTASDILKKRRKENH